MERYMELLQTLHSKGMAVRCPPELHGSIHHVTLPYRRPLVTEYVNLLLALDPKTHNDILLKAINGHLEDAMLTSMMYACGLGMPRDDGAAAAWARFALMEPADDRTYVEAVKQLKSDRKEVLATCNVEGLIMPFRFIEALNGFKAIYSSEKYTGQKLKGIHVTPVLNGIHVTLLYRPIETSEGTKAVLYGVVLPQADGLTISRNYHKHFNVPQMLGEIRGKNTIPDYNPFGTVKCYCVTGYLTTPRSLIKARKNLPHGETVRSLFNAVVSGKFDEEAVIEQQANGVKAEIQAKIAELKGKNKPKALAKWNARLANTAKIRRLAIKRAEPEFARTYLHFVASDYMLWRKGQLVSADLKRDTIKHLQSIGFRSFSHPAVETVNYTYGESVISETELDNVFRTFQDAYPDYGMTRLMLRQYGNSVKVKKAYYYRRRS